MNTSRTLLFIDDESHILKSLERSLRKEPYQLVVTTDPTQVLHLIKQHAVQVVISDYRMENKTGLEVLQELEKKFPKVIRVILSGYADESLIDAALKNGNVHAYLLKPFDTENLKSNILKFFTQYENNEKSHL